METWRNKQRGRRWWSLKFWARNVRRWYRSACGSVLWPRIWSGSVCLCWYYKESVKVDLGYYLTLSLNHRRDLLLLVLCIQHNVIFHWYWAVRLSSTNRWLWCCLWCLDRRLCFSCTGGETTSSLAISEKTMWKVCQAFSQAVSAYASTLSLLENILNKYKVVSWSHSSAKLVILVWFMVLEGPLVSWSDEETTDGTLRY